MHDFHKHKKIAEMQSNSGNNNNNGTGGGGDGPSALGSNRIFIYSVIDPKDDLEEKLEKARISVDRLVGHLSERDGHDVLANAFLHKHDETCLGLLGTILVSKQLGNKYFNDMILLSREFNVVVDVLSDIIVTKYHRLSDVSRDQLLYLIREIVKANLLGAETLCWNIMRQIAGGDTSNRNGWLCEEMLAIYSNHRAWLGKYPVLTAAVIYTYLRLLEDHTTPNTSSLRQKETTFVVSLIREHFQDVVMSQQIGLGRDFVRLLQTVGRIPEIEALWRDIYFNPKTLSPHFTGVAQLLNLRTSRKFFLLRITPDMERKLHFMTTSVKFGMHKRYQEWFQRQYLSTPESQTLRSDLIRFIVGVIHPSNEILCSDVLPRWAIIGWLLTTCTNSVAAANAKLALFYDWIYFDAAKDNIMNIEPGILVMQNSLKPHLAITTTLLDFLIRLTYEYLPEHTEKIRIGVGAALKTVLLKKVLSSLDLLLENPKFEPDLRNAIQEHLIPLLDRNNGAKNETMSGGVNHIAVNSFPPSSEYNQMNPAMQSVVNSSNLSNLPQVLSNVIITSNSYSNSAPNTITLRASPPLHPPPSSMSLASSSHTTSAANTIFNSTIVPQSSTSNVNNSFNSSGADKTDRFKFGQPEEDFSDDEDDTYSEISQSDMLLPKVFAGAVPIRSSPTLGSSVEEAERSKIFELAQSFPTSVRLAIEGLMSDSISMSGSNRKDYIEDIVEELSDPNLDNATREGISKCFLHIFKSDLSKPCLNDESSNIIDNLTISPLSEFLSILVPRPSDKKLKNLMKLLADLINGHPSIGYKLLIILYQKKEAGKITKREDHFPLLYKNLAHIRGLKLDAQLIQDVRCCWENEQLAIAYLCPVIYTWYENDCISGSNVEELLRLVISTLDSYQLQDLVWKVMVGPLKLIDDHMPLNIINKSLEWESWEQHCVWTLLVAHNKICMDDILPIVHQLDATNHSEALTAFLFMLKKEKPTQHLLTSLLCRKATPRDHFLLSLCSSWSRDYEEELAEGLALVLGASGSPVKRKRGPTGGRGIASPGGPPTPTLDNVLGHLDQLREHTTIAFGEGIFSKDAMQAALLQVQSWVNDSQKNKYRSLLALAAEEPDSKESRSFPKRSTTPRKLPSSPTPPGSSSTISNSNSNTIPASGNITSSSTSSNQLSRTRSGRTRTPLKDESSDTSEEDDDIPRPKKIKKRKHATAFNSDSD